MSFYTLAVVATNVAACRKIQINCTVFKGVKNVYSYVQLLKTLVTEGRIDYHLLYVMFDALLCFELNATSIPHSIV